MRTTSKWRTIDEAKKLQRIKALQNGPEKPFEIGGVIGLGAPDANGQPSRDTILKQRILNAITPTPTAEEAEAELEATLADQQLKEAKELANG